MVEIINHTIFNGISGRRPTEKPKYFVLHNDAGNMGAEQYIGFLESRYNNEQSHLGFAHYYIDRFKIVRVEDTFNGAWSAGNPDGNIYSLSYEVCQQYSTTDIEFIQNENMVLMQMAEDMSYYEMTPNYDNIKFHNEFCPTNCPKRSLELHGGNNDSLRDYVIERITHYQSLGKTVQEMINAQSEIKEGWIKNDVGWWYQKSDGSYTTNDWQEIDSEWFYFNQEGYCLMNQWYYDGVDYYYLDARGAMVVGWFLVGTEWFYFNSSGRMVKGWVKYKQHWYYLNTTNGHMESHQFVRHGDGWYYLNDDGTMAEKPDFKVEPNGLITTK